MTIDVEQYLNKTFPGLTLTPSLFQQWDIGIHVEFGTGFYQWKNNVRLNLAMFPDVFFINLTKNVILFIYDDRGCEVIATNKETIKPVGLKFRNWIDNCK